MDGGDVAQTTEAALEVTAGRECGSLNLSSRGQEAQAMATEGQSPCLTVTNGHVAWSIPSVPEKGFGG